VTVRNDWYYTKRQCKLHIKCSKPRKCFEGFVEYSHDKCSEDKQRDVKYIWQTESSGSLAFNSHTKTYEVKQSLNRSSQLPRLQETLKKLVKRAMPQQILQKSCCSSRLRKNLFLVKIYILSTSLWFTMKEYSHQSQSFPPPYVMDSKMITTTLVFFVLPNKHHTS
jgi:hypothetical protein